MSSHPNHIATCHGVVRATTLFHHHYFRSSSTGHSALPQLKGLDEEHPPLTKYSTDYTPPALIGVMLDSTNLLRKYLGPLDIPLSLLLQTKGYTQGRRLDEKQTWGEERQRGCGTSGDCSGSEMFSLVNPFPWRVYLAMAAHRTQFVWYRRIFVVFSRFTYVNSFRVFYRSVNN